MPQISPVVNLGAPGLAGTLIFQAYLQATYDGDAVPVSVSGITVVPRLDLFGAPTSNYQITGLPDPVPGGYGTVFIYSSAGALIRSFEYSTPAVAPLLLFRAETVVVPNSPATDIDTLGNLAALDVKGLPDPSGAVIDFSLKDGAGTVVLANRPAAATNIVPLTDGSYGFTLTYAMEVGHPVPANSAEPVGSFTRLYGEFRINYGSGIVKAVPGEGLLVMVRKAYS